jgi:predicted transglutaminase-like protease
MWFLLVVSITAFVSINLTILATIVSILHSNRKMPWGEVPRALKNVFWPSISIDFLLEYRLGVCRDYAKITACLLLNISPNAEIYFATAPNHVATGISVDNRLHMLDQRLPILTIDKWNDYRKPKKSDRIERFDSVKGIIQKADKATFLQTEAKYGYELNTDSLAKTMMELMNIERQPDDETISLLEPMLIRWKNGVTLYKENEMTDYSLARYLEMRISNEFVKKERITMIEANRNNDDIIFTVHVSEDRKW